MPSHRAAGKHLLTQEAGAFSVTETVHRAGLELAPHEHAHACLHVVLDGCYREATRSGSRSFGPGTTLFKPAGERHWNAFDRGDSRSLRLELKGAALTEVGALPHPPQDRVRDPRLAGIADRIRSEMRDGDDLSAFAIESLGLELVTEFWRSARRRRTSSHELAERCADVLQGSFRSSIDLGRLSVALECSRSHLARSFRRRYGCSMGEFVRELRVADVLLQLEATGAELGEIALRAGFADQSHCTRVFRRLVGRTPGAVRAEALEHGRTTGAARSRRDLPKG